MAAAQRGEEPLSVHEAVMVASSHIDAIPQLTVTGEVSGFRGPNSRSGHCYFQLKDDQSAMDAIVWRGTYQKCGFRLKDGLQVQMTGKFNVYAASGRMSFVARRLSLAGEGLMRQQVAQLARKLQAEGLMDETRKRRIPRFCTRVCVVTSLSGSVIEDVKRTLARRNPLVQIQVVGCAVQGDGAPATIIRALRVAADARPDAILLVRGGGSFEDLMTFNDEALARAVAACPVPVITGIGHEPDTSICDMVSDRRCSTPTAAAESVAPALDEIVSMMEERQSRLAKAMADLVAREADGVSRLSSELGVAMQADLRRRGVWLAAIASRRCLTDPRAMLEDRQAQLNLTEERLHDAIPRSLARRREALGRDARALDGAGRRLLAPYEAGVARMAGTLDALSPLKVLSRGYSIVRDGEGHVVDDARALACGDEVGVLLGRGSFSARVESVDEGDRN